jgi:ribosomal protein S18 acetylase RimI-like enzyme
MQVRPYAPSDRDSVIELWRDVFGYTEPRNRPEHVLDELAAGHAELFVAVDEAGVAGTLLAGFDGHRGWLYRAAVAPRARRRGAGRALVVTAEAALRRKGCVKINLQTFAENDTAVAFWKSVGYRVEPRVSMGKDCSDVP